MLEKKKFAFAFKSWRKSKDLTQKEVADKLNISRATVIAWENIEDDKLPDEYYINLLNEIFQADFSHILAEPIMEYSKKSESNKSEILMDIMNAHKEIKNDLKNALELLDQIISENSIDQSELLYKRYENLRDLLIHMSFKI